MTPAYNSKERKYPQWIISFPYMSHTHPKAALFIASLLIFCAYLNLACENQDVDRPYNSGSSEKNQIGLRLKLELTYALSHGWGHVYSGKVEKVLSGNLKDSVINLHVSVWDFKRKYSQIITEESVNRVIVEFRLIENDKPYINGVNAFMDEKGRTWEIVNILTVEKK